MKAVHRAEEEPVPYSALLEVAPLLEDESEPSENENQPKKTLLRAMLAAGRFLLLALVLAAFAFCAFGTCTAPRNAIEAENCRREFLPVNGMCQEQVRRISRDYDGYQRKRRADDQLQSFHDRDCIRHPNLPFRLLPGTGRAVHHCHLAVRYVAANSAVVLTDSSTGLVDCGNWAVSASWTVPSTATSGIYFAKLVRTDTGEASPILFIVRNDSSHSDILAQTSDLNWHAYNDYGGNSLYSGNPVGRAYQVSYNRPVASSTSVTITASYGI